MTDTIEPVAPEVEQAEPGAGVRPPDPGSAALFILACLAVIYTLHVARVFFLPVIFAVLLDFTLTPVVRWLGRWRLLKPPIAAALVMAVLVGALGLGIYKLADPLQSWIAKAPETVADARTKIRRLIRPVEQVNQAAAQVESATQPAGGTAAPPSVVVRGPSFAERVFGTTQTIFIGLCEVLVLLYFLLASGDLFLNKMVRSLPAFADKKKAVSITRDSKAAVSRYLGTLTLMNVGFGAVVALVMQLAGMPNPVLWGVAAGLLEFVPYLGALTMTLILTLAGLVTFETAGRALIAPAAYVTVNVIQGNAINPWILSSRLTLNPVALFVGLLFWTLVWGIAGAFLAVPLLATLKIFCDHTEGLKPIGEFLGK